MLEVGLKNLGMFTMIYFVFLKASKPLKNRHYWINYLLRPACLTSFLVTISTVVYLEIQITAYFNAKSNEEANAILTTLSCTSYLWVISSIFDFISVLMFWIFLIKLDQETTKTIIKEQEDFNIPQEQFTK